MRRFICLSGWQQIAIAIIFMALGVALPITEFFAQSSRSHFCREYARDYSLRYSRGGAMGGVVRGGSVAPSLAAS